MSVKIEFVLFRSKLIKPQEPTLFGEIHRPELLTKAIFERKSISLRRGQIWHIGNITSYAAWPTTKGYFAIGRTTKAINEKFDKAKSEFTEEEFETSPYTHVFFDAEIGLFLVASKSKLSTSVDGIARRLQEILNSANITENHGYQILINPIPDPKEFITSLHLAYQIKEFSISFTKPNPFDADEYFQKPMEKILEASNGTKGKAVIEGDALDSAPLIELSHSAAATANTASAKIIEGKGKRAVRKYLKGNPAKFSVSEGHATNPSVLNQGIDIYLRIRGNTDED